MRNEPVSEATFFDDLSATLTIFKTKVLLLNQKYAFQEQIIKTESEKQQQTLRNEKVKQLCEKYRQFSTSEKCCLIIMKRFLARVGEILRNQTGSMTKNKLSLLLIYKQIEREIANQLTSENIGKLILYVLESIPSEIKTTEKHHQLKIRLITASSEDKITWKIQKGRQKLIENAQYKLIENAQQKLTDIFQKNVNKFASMGLDTDHLRRVYFDLREDNSQQQTFQNMFLDMQVRNKFVRCQMNFYEKQYCEYQKRLKQENFCPRKKGKKCMQICDNASNTYSTLTNLKSNRYIPYIEQRKSMAKRQKYSRIKSAVSKVSKNTSETITYINTMEINHDDLYQPINHDDLYQTIYEEKKGERVKNSIKMKNVTFGFTPTSGRVATTKDEVLERRKQFYKKTQDHLKLRYHYINRRQAGFPIKMQPKHHGKVFES